MDAVDGHDESEHEGGYRGKVSGSGFKVQGLASGPWGGGFKVQCSGFMV